MRFDLLACVLAILCPLLILTANLSKSPVVGAIVVVPFLLLVALLCAPAWQPAAGEDSQAVPASADSSLGTAAGRFVRRLPLPVVAVLVLAFGFGRFVDNAVEPHYRRAIADQEAITTMNVDIARYFAEAGLVSPKISYDRVIDYINVGTIEYFSYTRFGRFANLVPRFGHGQFGIFATERDVALQLVQESDIVVLTDPKIERTHPYPMNQKIAEYWDELSQWTKANRVLLQSYMIGPVPYHIYVPKSAD